MREIGTVGDLEKVKCCTIYRTRQNAHATAAEASTTAREQATSSVNCRMQLTDHATACDMAKTPANHPIQHTAHATANAAEATAMASTTVWKPAIVLSTNAKKTVKRSVTAVQRIETSPCDTSGKRDGHRIRTR